MATTTSTNLRTRRRRAGLTQAELAGRAKCSLTFIGNLERGYVPNRSAALVRIEAVLDANKNEDPATANSPSPQKADGAGRRRAG